MELYDSVEEKGSDWQKRAFEAIDPHGSRVSICTANGVGKTSKIVTGAILWHMAVFPKSLAVSTAGAFRQVKSQLFPNLLEFAECFPGWKFKPGSLEIEAPNGSRYLGFSTDDEGKAEGYHGQKEALYEIDHHQSKGPLMIILDEAKTVPDGIKDAAERCTYQRLLLTSSTGFAEGFFWESHKKKSKFYHTLKIPQKGHFEETRVGSDVPVDLGYQENRHVDFEKGDKLREELGPNHPLVRSTLDAEFMDDVEGAIISYAAVERSMNHPPQSEPGIHCGYCDFAAGGDENVFAVRRGNVIELVKCWRENDTLKACAEFALLFKKSGLRPDMIGGDDDGLGTVMIDNLHGMGWGIRRLKGGSKARDPDDYFNRTSELWYEAAEQIKRNLFVLPDDPELRIQLASRKGKPNLRQRLQAEPKKDMLARGLSSPDRADAVVNLMGWNEVTDPLEVNDFERRSLPAFSVDSAGNVQVEDQEVEGIYAGL